MRRRFSKNRERYREQLEQPHYPRCGTSRKICFPSHESALQRGGELLTEGKFAGPIRAYQCQFCNQYHLTSH